MKTTSSNAKARSNSTKVNSSSAKARNNDNNKKTRSNAMKAKMNGAKVKNNITKTRSSSVKADNNKTRAKNEWHEVVAWRQKKKKNPKAINSKMKVKNNAIFFIKMTTKKTNKKMGPKCEGWPFYRTSTLLIGFEVVMFEPWLP